MSRTILFHRDFREYSGGHGKVWNYFNHSLAHPGWCPKIYLAPGSARAGNPWIEHGCPLEAEWDAGSADALFLAGMDWTSYPADDAARPVVNLVQHLRHGDPAHPLYAYLSRRAVRICVSQEVASAILATGEVNGPVRVIPAALDLPAMPGQPGGREGIFIGATKDPDLGCALRNRLQERGDKVQLVSTPLPRDAFLRGLARSRVAVLLPSPTEGFYLPALEAMALGCATVVPDCLGNREYLRPGENALVPAHALEQILDAVARLRDPGLAARLVAGGTETASHFNLARERLAFYSVLDQLDALWAS